MQTPQLAHKHSLFTRFAKWTAHATGRPLTFAIAFGVILAWAVTGPLFHQAATRGSSGVNTSTTIVTFLMVFPHPEHPEPHRGAARQARRDHPGR
ncbi:MAG: low affinity iron permease family protein [Polyangiales bacterium]